MAESEQTGSAREWLASLEEALARGEIETAVGLFGEECYWRDLVSFTWNLKTCEGREQIANMLAHTLARTRPTGFALEGDANDAEGVTEAWFTFETATGRGKGHLRLIDGKAWTVLTTLQELKGFEEPRGDARARGAQHGAFKGRETWVEERRREREELGYKTQPYCVIIGGGQCGIALGARLRMLKVPTLIIEKHERPGDSWRKRYKSLHLHAPVWRDHLPYLPFPDHWPVFGPKDKLGDWLDMYTQIMELVYWTKSEAMSARYDAAAKEWSLRVDRNGEPIELRPKQLVLATGMSGFPNVPEFPGQDLFKGEQQHSSEHPGADAYEGKKVIVIGSNNTSHDICQALWETDSDVTMVQRSSTHVVKSETLMEVAVDPLYSEEALRNGITTDIADLMFASIPFKVLPNSQKQQTDTIRARDKDLYERLAVAGFDVDFGEDETGLFMMYLRRAGGEYIDVGASELIINGEIKLAKGQVVRLTEDSVVLDDGTELPADLVVYATGYGSMNGWAARLISQEVADKVGKCWGLGSGTKYDPGPWEGELRNMWKPTQQEALWFHGGDLYQSRQYSQFLSLQLKARMEGIETPVYGLPEVHHLS